MKSRNNEPLGFSWSYRDFLWSLLAGFLALAMIAFLSNSLTKQKTVYLGDVIVQMNWTAQSDSDVDLWVQSPKIPTSTHPGNEDDPVGYSRQDGLNCNLIRDDLGRSVDVESTNLEHTVCLKKLAGLWIVDAMIYRAYDSTFPIEVTVKFMKWENGGYKVILHKTLTFQSNGQIQTYWQFNLDSNGNIVPGTLNNNFVDLFARETDHTASNPSPSVDTGQRYEPH